MKANELRHRALAVQNEKQIKANVQLLDFYAHAQYMADQGKFSTEYKHPLNKVAQKILQDEGFVVRADADGFGGFTLLTVSWGDDALDAEVEKRAEPTLKLFVWHDALTDYTSGVMFALAHTVDEARELISPGYRERRSFSDPARVVNPLEDAELKQEPKVYEAPIGFAVAGGS